MKSNEKTKLDSLQILRGVAATLVLISHAVKEVAPNINENTIGFSLQKGGQFGVDIFFIISGFIMAYVITRDFKQPMSAKDFLMRRIIRIVPMYWLFTTLTIFISFYGPNLKNHGETDLKYILGSYLFFPVLRADGHATPALGVGWTLNYEIIFYLIFSMCIFMDRSKASIISIITIVSLVFFGMFLPNAFSPVWYWTRPIILEFAFGIALCMAFLRGWRISNTTSTILLVTGWIWWYLGSSHSDPTDSYVRIQAWGFPALLIFVGFILCQTPIETVLPKSLRHIATKIGDCSYSIYLCHMFVVRAEMILFDRFFPDFRDQTILCAFVLVLTSIAASYIVYKLIEVPVTRKLDQKWSKKQKTR